VERDDYVRRLLDAYRSTPGTTGAVRRADRQLAAQLYERGVPLAAAEHALVLAAVRRLARPAGSPPLPPVRSLAYFAPIIHEVLGGDIDPGYDHYLREKLRHLRADPR